jgi:Icc protein
MNIMNIPTLYHPTKQLLWISDIHLEEANDDEKRRFFDKLSNARCDAVLLTGDVSNSEHLVDDLTEVAQACGAKPCFLLLGNHDYFGSSFAVVDQAVADLCTRHRNLITLGQGEIIELSPNTALVGCRGWYDGQAGAGAQTKVGSADRYLIDDFRNISSARYFEKLRMLGHESASYLRNVLPLALTCYSKVLVGTHIPPFSQALRHRGTHCDWDRQPYFANRSAGNAIFGISKRFPKRQVEVLSGHSHCYVELSLNPNLHIRVAGAQPGFPALQPLITIV